MSYLTVLLYLLSGIWIVLLLGHGRTPLTEMPNKVYNPASDSLLKTSS